MLFTRSGFSKDLQDSGSFEEVVVTIVWLTYSFQANYVTVDLEMLNFHFMKLYLMPVELVMWLVTVDCDVQVVFEAPHFILYLSLFKA